MKETPPSGAHLIDVVLWVWFALTALAVTYVVYDQFKRGPEHKETSVAMQTMRWGWVLITLYTGVFALIAYGVLPRASAGGTLEPPLWKQTRYGDFSMSAGDPRMGADADHSRAATKGTE